MVNATDFSINSSYSRIKQFETKYLRANLPNFFVGDIIRINLCIQDGNKERTQLVQGVVISINYANLNTTVTIRKSLQGIGVERIYLIHSPKITKIEVVKQSKVRKAKLFYLRSKYGKATRLKSRLI